MHPQSESKRAEIDERETVGLEQATYFFTRWDRRIRRGLTLNVISDTKGRVDPSYEFSIERPWGKGSTFVSIDLNRKEMKELSAAIDFALRQTAGSDE